MALQKVKIIHDGNHYVTSLQNFFSAGGGRKGPKKVDSVYEQFKIFYGEAVKKRITKKKIVEYIQGKFIDVCEDPLDIPNLDDLYDYYLRYVSTLHKRMLRYRRKAYLNDWNYFVTFTYSDEKMSRKEFEIKIISKLRDLSSHSGWNYMMRWEDGELGERKHLHAFLYVPEGKMIGELYEDSHYSSKRRRMEYFTNNTYFNERFGISEWKELKSLRNCKSLINYLAKYMAKDDGKIIYSRGIPDYIEAEIDMENDIVLTYETKYAVLAIVNEFMFGTAEDFKEALADSFDIAQLPQIQASPVLI